MLKLHCSLYSFLSNLTIPIRCIRLYQWLLGSCIGIHVACLHKNIIVDSPLLFYCMGLCSCFGSCMLKRRSLLTVQKIACKWNPISSFHLYAISPFRKAQMRVCPCLVVLSLLPSRLVLSVPPPPPLFRRPRRRRHLCSEVSFTDTPWGGFRGREGRRKGDLWGVSGRRGERKRERRLTNAPSPGWERKTNKERTGRRPDKTHSGATTCAHVFHS